MAVGELKAAEAGASLPEVDPERCVLSAAIAASCRACVEACPRSAYVVSDSALGLDTEACDGCAICAATCPQSAISISRTAPVSSPDDPTLVLAACEIAIPHGGKGVSACLDSIGLAELAQLHARGVRRLIITRGDCASCNRGHHRFFDAAVRDLGRLLDDRDEPRLTLDEVAPARWDQSRTSAAAPSRRGFLMALRGGGRPLAGPDAHERQPIAGLLKPPRKSTPLHRFLPDIEAGRCIACDACARICPEGAILLETDPGGPSSYLIEPENCTGCRLCVDVCDQGAVTLGSWRRSGTHRLRLDQQQCASCGNVFREPSGRQSDRRLCRICSDLPANRRLFQVIE